MEKAIASAKAEQVWNQESSVKCICALYESEVGEKPNEEFTMWVNQLVNPSAFRQKLEKGGVLAKATDGTKKLVGFDALIAKVAAVKK